MASAAFLASKTQAGVSGSWNLKWKLLVELLDNEVPRLPAVTTGGCTHGGGGEAGAVAVGVGRTGKTLAEAQRGEIVLNC